MFEVKKKKQKGEFWDAIASASVPTLVGTKGNKIFGSGDKNVRIIRR